MSVSARLVGLLVLTLVLPMLASAAEAPRKVAAAATANQGIEPDEIDARAESRARAATRATPARTARPVPTPGRFAVASNDQGQPQPYETADCSTEEKEITCCTKGDGPGASCNLFILLCNESGGTGKGDGGDAICVK